MSVGTDSADKTDETPTDPRCGDDRDIACCTCKPVIEEENDFTKKDDPCGLVSKLALAQDAFRKLAACLKPGGDTPEAVKLAREAVERLPMSACLQVVGDTIQRFLPTLRSDTSTREPDVALSQEVADKYMNVAEILQTNGLILMAIGLAYHVTKELMASTADKDTMRGQFSVPIELGLDALQKTSTCYGSADVTLQSVALAKEAATRFRECITASFMAKKESSQDDRILRARPTRRASEPCLRRISM